MSHVLRRVPGTFAVARLDPNEGWPWWATRSAAFASVTRTPHETSVVCDAASVPPTARAERDFALYGVEGPIPFAVVGVLASLVQPLAAAGISVVTVSTFDTDYLLCSLASEARTVTAWREAGHTVHPD